MRTFKEYLIETMVQPDEINYAFKKFTDLIHNKKNITAAKKILAQPDVKKDTVSSINKSRNKQDFTTFRTKSKKERDAVVAIYILMNTSGYSVNITNPDNFTENVKDYIVAPLRKFAANANIKSPEPEKGPIVPGARYKQSEQELKEPEDKGKEELAAKVAKPEPEGEEPEGEEETPEEPTEKEKDPNARKETESDIDVDFPNPLAVAKKIAEIKTDAIEQYEKEVEGKEFTRAQKASLDRTHNKLLSKLDGLEKNARKQNVGFSVSPTPSSKRKASTNAKLALNSAQSAARKSDLKVQLKQLPSRVSVLKQRVGETKEAIADRLSSPARSRGAELGKAAIGRVAELGKAAVGKATEKVSHRMNINKVKKFLGDEKAQEYSDAIFNKDTKKAEEILNSITVSKEQEAAKKTHERDVKQISGTSTADKLAAGRKAILQKAAAGAAAAQGAIKKVGAKIGTAATDFRTKRTIGKAPDFTGKKPLTPEEEKRRA